MTTEASRRLSATAELLVIVIWHYTHILKWIYEYYYDCYVNDCFQYAYFSHCNACRSSNTWHIINPLMGTLKPQSNGPLYSSTVTGTLAVDGRAVTFGTAKRDLGARPPLSPLLAVPN